MSEAAAPEPKRKHYTAVSGWGLVLCSLLIPVIAVTAAETRLGWSRVWITGILLCGVIMSVLTYRRAQRAPHRPRFPRLARVIGGFLPWAFICAGSSIMLYSDHEEWLPIIWISCYAMMLIICNMGSLISLQILGLCLLGLNYPFWTSVVHVGLTPVPNMGSLTGGDLLVIIGLGAMQLPFALYIAIRYR